MPDSLLKWIRPEIRELSAYHVPDASGLVKLDAMENPYVIDGEARTSWLQAVAQTSINRYPDPSATALKSAIKRLMRPPPDSAMVLGNGSDELIQMLAMAVAAPGRSLLSLEPGFVMYRMIAGYVGMDYVGVPLNDDFEIDLEATLAAIAEHDPVLVFIAYPNNPTANCFDDAAMLEITRAVNGLVVIDEAYHPFAQRSWLPRLAEFDKLLVMRTVSKMGLAGLRLGVLFGHPLLVGEIDKLRLPYNINCLTQAAATSILNDPDLLERQAADIREQREILFSALEAMPGVRPFRSDANFILLRLEQQDAGEVFSSIREQGVLIKNMNYSDGLLRNCLRVTVGTPAENERLLQALGSSLSNQTPA